MKPCCLQSMKRYLKKHRDAATCDTCGYLLLAYDNEHDFEKTKKALTAQGMAFEIEAFGKLQVIAKPRLRKK